LIVHDRAFFSRSANRDTLRTEVLVRSDPCRWFILAIAIGLLALLPCLAQGDPGPISPTTAPTTLPDIAGQKLPHIQIDLKNRKVRVECEALAVDAPVEFFCCVKGSNDYESILRSEVKPSDLHLALLAVGLKPGAPLTYNESTNKWIPPRGAPLHVDVEFQKDGKTVTLPAYRLMRDDKTKKEPPAFSWVFAGSRVMPDGKYAADITGYLLSVCNFDLTVIDVPDIVSSSNDTLEWERNPDNMPKAGATVWMIISAAKPGEKADVLPPRSTAPKPPSTQSSPAPSPFGL
jgi:hypothetical protein